VTGEAGATKDNDIAKFLGEWQTNQLSPGLIEARVANSPPAGAMRVACHL
jgi:hypothetical protein